MAGALGHAAHNQRWVLPGSGTAPGCRAQPPASPLEVAPPRPPSDSPDRKPAGFLLPLAMKCFPIRRRGPSEACTCPSLPLARSLCGWERMRRWGPREPVFCALCAQTNSLWARRASRHTGVPVWMVEAEDARWALAGPTEVPSELSWCGCGAAGRLCLLPVGWAQPPSRRPVLQGPGREPPWWRALLRSWARCVAAARRQSVRSGFPRHPAVGVVRGLATERTGKAAQSSCPCPASLALLRLRPLPMWPCLCPDIGWPCSSRPVIAVAPSLPSV